MVKHTHKAGESLIGMPEEVLIRYEGEYYLGYEIGNGYAAGNAYDSDGIMFAQDNSFDWYDLTELGE